MNYSFCIPDIQVNISSNTTELLDDEGVGQFVRQTDNCSGFCMVDNVDREMVPRVIFITCLSNGAQGWRGILDCLVTIIPNRNLRTQSRHTHYIEYTEYIEYLYTIHTYKLYALYTVYAKTHIIHTETLYTLYT